MSGAERRGARAVGEAGPYWGDVEWPADAPSHGSGDVDFALPDDLWGDEVDDPLEIETGLITSEPILRLLPSPTPAGTGPRGKREPLTQPERFLPSSRATASRSAPSGRLDAPALDALLHLDAQQWG